MSMMLRRPSGVAEEMSASLQMELHKTLKETPMEEQPAELLSLEKSEDSKKAE